MRKHLIRALVVGGAAAAAVALVAGQASAASTVTITGANASFSGSSSNTRLADVTSGQTFACTSSTASGSLGNVTSAPLPFTTKRSDGTTPHSITGLSYSGCTSSFGTATVSVPAGDLPDDLTITGVSTTAPQATGFVQTAGTNGLLVHISVLTCSFDVTGQANATWTNGTSGQLKFVGTGTLHPVNISPGCFGLVNSGDTMTYTGTYNVTPTTIHVSTP